ncbi:hypothetical protein M9458_052424, partial [Cirrhinus mrigala]
MPRRPAPSETHRIASCQLTPRREPPHTAPTVRTACPAQTNPPGPRLHPFSQPGTAAAAASPRTPASARSRTPATPPRSGLSTVSMASHFNIKDNMDVCGVLSPVSPSSSPSPLVPSSFPKPPLIPSIPPECPPEPELPPEPKLPPERPSEPAPPERPPVSTSPKPGLPVLSWAKDTLSFPKKIFFGGGATPLTRHGRLDYVLGHGSLSSLIRPGGVPPIPPVAPTPPPRCICYGASCALWGGQCQTIWTILCVFPPCMPLFGLPVPDSLSTAACAENRPMDPWALSLRSNELNLRLSGLMLPMLVSPAFLVPPRSLFSAWLPVSGLLHTSTISRTKTRPHKMSTETPAAADPFTELVNAFKAALNPSTPPSASGSPMATPATYAGRAAECSVFLLQVNLGLNTATGTLSTSDQLFRLRQGSSSIHDYTLHFRTLAAASGWNDISLLGAYRQGLNPEIRAAMAIYDDSIGLEPFLLRTTHVSQQLAACQPPVTAPSAYQSRCKLILHGSHASNAIAASALDFAFTAVNLVTFSATAHIITSEIEPTLLTLIPVTLHTSDRAVSTSALIDSGSSGNFISTDCLKKLHLSRQRHHHEYAVTTIQGKPLGHGRVQHSSPYITLQIGLFHFEEIKLLVLEGSTINIILGRPWLRLHHPEIRWDPCDITRWSKNCFDHCISRIPHRHITPVPLASTQIESPEPINTPEILTEYRAFQDVFSKQAATQLPPHRPWDCAIDLLPGAQLPKGKVYPLSIPERQAMEVYITEALNQGFTRPSTSPAASSFFFVGKKDGGLRLCTDYRQLNSQTLCFVGPSAYNLVRIHEGDEWKTTFVTPTGHYEYLVMPYGLSISPSVFQTFMNKVFREFLNRFVVVYIDDILIYSRNMAEHRQHVQQVLLKLRQHQLYLKLENCEFHQPSVQFLGFNISAEGVHMDQGKVNAILRWPQPHNIKELQRFLGFTNFYRHFIQDYSSITAPLTSLLWGKPKHLTWNPATHEAFQHLKLLFSTAPLLRHPDPELPFTVEVDAYTAGVGAVLSQAAGDSALLHPCAFYSHKLSPAEQNYDVGNRELLAIKLALDEWRHWLEGVRHPFTIITDHKDLQYLRDAKRLNPRQAHWALFFTCFHFKITYHPGSKNVPAGAISRLSSRESPTDPEPVIPPIIWDIDRDIRQATLQEPAPPDCPEGKLYVLSSLPQRLLGAAHQSPGSGHPGSKWTLSLLQSGGPVCAGTPSGTSRAALSVPGLTFLACHPAGLLVPLPIPERPWSHLGVDFVTDLPTSEGNTCILVVVDRFSKMCKLIPLKGLPTAMEAAEHLFHHVFRQFGIPEEIVSDRGPQFISHVWKAFFKLLGVSVNLSSGYHPQTNCQTERKIQELGRYLRAYCQEDQHSWSRFLPWAEYAQNSLRQDSTGLTPFQCVLGYQPPLFPWTEEPSNVPAVDHWFRESQRVWDSAHHHLQRAIHRNKHFADARRRVAPPYQPGDSVWLSTCDLRLPCRKLSPCYIGPFKILRQINDVTFQLQLPPRYRIHPTFHVSLLKPYFPSATEPPGAEAGPPPPEVLDQPATYTVHQILDSRRRGGHLEYLIDWEGYRPEERSWVPRDDVLDPSLLSDFHRDHPDRPAPCGGGRPRRRVRA